MEGKYVQHDIGNLNTFESHRGGRRQESEKGRKIYFMHRSHKRYSRSLLFPFSAFLFGTLKSTMLSGIRAELSFFCFFFLATLRFIASTHGDGRGRRKGTNESRNEMPESWAISRRKLERVSGYKQNFSISFSSKDAQCVMYKDF